MQSEPRPIHGGHQHGLELVLAHPIDAQLDWDLENEEASLTPWVLCHEGV